MRLTCALILIILTQVLATPCTNKKSNLKLVCYYSDVSEIDICKCTHIVLPSNTNISTIENVKATFREGKTLLTVNEFNQNLIDILNKKAVDGVDINLKKVNDKSDVGDFISTVKSKLNPDLLIAVSIPSKPEVLAKFYNLKDLSKHAEFFILQTAFLASSHNVTFHPSRLSGIWDTQNTDSMVDLVHGLGAPLSKIVISTPVQAFQFTLQNVSQNIAGSPAVDVKSITRKQFCKKVNSEKNWTLERDQDQTGPYVFLKKDWIAFEDVKSIDIKAKYARVRGLAGLALKDLSQDDDVSCKMSLLEAAYNGLTKQARAPRSAVLQSLKQEILQSSSRPLDAIQISPYRISRVIDVQGNIHSIRQDTRTEFECSRQGYFVHPRSCGRFYRCVKFDQLSDDFNVFEFDCPDGLIFDSKTEVCVWPGSLPDTSACSGSSEIAPVPKSRYICPSEEGYYADPENCRWFFACLDHGKSPLSAYEFRCPFGLMFDQSRLVCEWSWLVPTCNNEEAIKYTQNFDNSQFNSYNGLGNLNIVKLNGLESGSKHLITDRNQGSPRYIFDDFGPVVQPQSDIRSNQQNLNKQNYFDSKLLQNGNNFHNQNGAHFIKILTVPNQQARVIGGISAVKSDSSNPQIFNTLTSLPLNSISILNPSPVAAVAAAPVPIIRSDQNTYKFGVVANVPELQYQVFPNKASGYGLNNLAYPKAFSSSDNFSKNYNSNFGLLPQSSLLLSKINSLSRQPIYVENYRVRPQIDLERTTNIQPSVYSSKLNSYSIQHPVNYQVQNVGDSSQFQTFDDSSVFNKIISSVSAPTVSNIHLSNNIQGVLKEGSAFGFQGGSVIRPQVSTQLITQTVPLVQSYKNVQTGNNREQIIKSTLHQQPALVSSYSYDTHLNDALIQQNGQIKSQVHEAHQNVVRSGNEENIGQNYVNQNSQYQNLNSDRYASVEVEKPALVSSYSYQNLKPQVQKTIDHKVYYDNGEQSEAQQIHSLQTQLNEHSNNEANHFEEYEHEQPAVILEEKRPEPVIIANPKPIDSNQRNSKFITSYSFQNLHSEGNQQARTTLPVVQSQATYSQNIHANADVYDSIQDDENVKANVEFLEISRATPTVLEEKIEIAKGNQEVLTHLPVVKSQTTYSQNIHPNAYESTQQYENAFSGYKYSTPKADAQFLEISRAIPTVVEQKIEIATGNQQSLANLPVVQSHVTYGQKIHHSSGVYDSNQHDENAFSGYKYSTPKANAQFFEISRSVPTTVVEEKIKIANENQQTLAHLPVVQSQATYGQNNHINVYDSTQQGQNVFSGYQYTTPKAHAQFLEIPRAIPTVVEEKIEIAKGNQQTLAHLPVVQSQATYGQNIHLNIYDSTQQDQNVFSGYQYTTPKANAQFLEISRSTPTVLEKKIEIAKLIPKIAKMQQAIYSTYQREGNQNHNKEENVQSSSHAFFNTNLNPSRILEQVDTLTKSNLTPVKPLSQDSVSNIGFQTFSAKLPQNIDIRANLDAQIEQVKQSDLTQNYDDDYYTIDQAKEKHMLYNVKQDEYGEGYDNAKPQIVLEEKYSKPFAVERSNVSFNEEEDYNYNVNFSPKRVQTYGLPAIKMQDEYIIEDYMDQKPSVQLSQNQFRFGSGVQKIVENYNIQNQDYEEGKQINQRTDYVETSTSTQPIIQVIQQTPSPIAKSTTREDDRQQNGIKEAGLEQSSFQGYDYSKPSIEFHDGIVLEDYKNRQPVQEEPIIAKQAYLTYDNQNAKVSTNDILLATEKSTVQFSTTQPSFTPEITNIVAIKPKGEFYYSDSRLQSTSTPLFESVVALKTANQIKTGGLTKSTAVPVQTYLPTKAFQEYELEHESDITITPKSPTTKTYVRINDVHPLLPAKLEAQCTCTSNPITLRRKLPTTTPSPLREDYHSTERQKPIRRKLTTTTLSSLSEDLHSTERQEPIRRKLPTTTPSPLSEDLYSIERQEPVLIQRKTVVVENYSFQPTTIIKSTSSPIETISATRAPVVVIKKRVRPVTSNQEPTPKEENIKILKESKIERLEQNFNDYETGTRRQSLPKSFECQRAGLFRHPKFCNKFYSCVWDCNKNKFNLHVFNCPIHLTFDYNMAACNWPSKGPSCEGNTLLPNE